MAGTDKFCSLISQLKLLRLGNTWPSQIYEEGLKVYVLRYSARKEKYCYFCILDRNDTSVMFCNAPLFALGFAENSLVMQVPAIMPPYNIRSFVGNPNSMWFIRI